MNITLPLTAVTLQYFAFLQLCNESAVTTDL